MRERKRSYEETYLSSRVHKRHNITLTLLIEDAKARSSDGLAARHVGHRRDEYHRQAPRLAYTTLGHPVSSRFAEASADAPFRCIAHTSWEPQR